MEKKVKELWERAVYNKNNKDSDAIVQNFAELMVEETLKEVDERTSPRGETSWFDSDKDWVRLHFGYGKLKQ